MRYLVLLLYISEKYFILISSTF